MNRLSLTLALCFFSCVSLPAAEPEHLAHRWEYEPDLGTIWLSPPTPPVPVLQAARLASPLQSIRLAEARLATRHACNPLLQGRETAFPVLLEQLNVKQENQAVLVSLATAAIALATPDHADLLWERLGNDAATRPLIERALIGWENPLALESWRARAGDTTASQDDFLRAIEGIGVTGDAEDQALLESLLRDDRYPSAVKVVVARALGRVAPSGLEGLAHHVLAAKIEAREILAAELVSLHSSDAARDILLDILQRDSLPAQTIAYAAIAENFPHLARELAADMLGRADNNLRLKACDVLGRFDDADSLNLLARGITDTNRQVRNVVREQMLQKAQLPELRTIVDEVIAYLLTGQSHQGIEQAILMAVALDDRNRAPQLVPLLEHPRPETQVYAAWGLQELADTPQVMQNILEFTQSVSNRLSTGEQVPELQILRQSFLFEALGRNEFRPAAEMLKIYVPKNGHKMGDLARASAIWALGKIFRGSQDAGLANQLAQRMHDEDVMDPENELVRYNATLALGWIGAPSSLYQLRAVAYEPPVPLGLAREWAIQQCSGGSEN